MKNILELFETIDLELNVNSIKVLFTKNIIYLDQKMKDDQKIVRVCSSTSHKTDGLDCMNFYKRTF